MPPEDDQSAARLAPLPVRAVGVDRPWHWLQLGWNDFARTPMAGLAHGLAIAAAGWLTMLLAPRA
jgi:uncharacterized membrane protein